MTSAKQDTSSATWTRWIATPTSTVSLHILQEYNILEQNIEQMNCPPLSGTADLLNWKTRGSYPQIQPQEPDFSKMFSNLTRNRWDLERQDIQCSSKHDFLGVLCIEIESDREKARQSVTNTEIVHNQSRTLLFDSDIWLVLWFSKGVQFKIKLTYLTLLPQRVVATMNYCAALLWYCNGMCCNFFIQSLLSLYLFCL